MKAGNRRCRCLTDNFPKVPKRLPFGCEVTLSLVSWLPSPYSRVKYRVSPPDGALSNDPRRTAYSARERENSRIMISQHSPTGFHYHELLSLRKAAATRLSGSGCSSSTTSRPNRRGTSFTSNPRAQANRHRVLVVWSSHHLLLLQ